MARVATPMAAGEAGQGLRVAFPVGTLSGVGFPISRQGGLCRFVSSCALTATLFALWLCLQSTDAGLSSTLWIQSPVLTYLPRLLQQLLMHYLLRFSGSQNYLPEPHPE